MYEKLTLSNQCSSGLAEEGKKLLGKVACLSANLEKEQS